MLIDPVSLALAGVVALGLAVIMRSHVRERRWYKEQRHRVESDRPPLSDAAFLGSVPGGAAEESLLLAVRRAVAESVGLPSEAIHPEDRLADLWRMQFLGPDLLDIIIRLERLLGVKISRQSVDASLNMRYRQEGEFREFAASLAHAISRATIDPRPER